jgi:hypothetical protein
MLQSKQHAVEDSSKNNHERFSFRFPVEVDRREGTQKVKIQVAKLRFTLLAGAL